MSECVEFWGEAKDRIDVREILDVLSVTGGVPRYLGIGNATVESAVPYRTERKARNGETGGCQIDLLIQTPKAAFVVEVKRKKRIGPEVEDEVRRKIRLLPVKSGKSKRPVLVYAGEIAKSVEADGYFDAIVPASRLLGL